jgi:hypothetical protein
MMNRSLNQRFAEPVEHDACALRLPGLGLLGVRRQSCTDRSPVD